jgi:tubulin monoglycylase TTLL3/8
VKPAGLSRGRGIRAFNDLEQLLLYVGGLDVQWVAQKYIEAPLTIRGKKFDIRQWVVVTEWKPLTVWFYNDCYVRLCGEDFEVSAFANPFAHLTNNSVAQRLQDYDER